jgi:dihydroorotase
MNRTQYNAIWLRGGTVIDPRRSRVEVADVAIVDGLVAKSAPDDAHTIDASSLIVCPGLMDIHIHLREPGQSHKETIETGTAAAAAGGFTYVACMPNTQPVLDSPEQVRWVIEQASKAGHCAVGPIAAITQGRAGRELTDFAALREAGAVAFSDDGTGIEDDAVMRRAFELAHDCDAVLIQHCEYKDISAGGVMHQGDVAERLGFPGLDPRSEEAMIERDIKLCQETGGRYHVAHISTAVGIELVRKAKSEGIRVTAEVCPHHLILTDTACAKADPNTKMHPPLRSALDVHACREGLLDGTIDCIVTDHAPHAENEKSVGFLKAPPGIVGLETAVGLAAHAMVETGIAGWQHMIVWLSTAPATVLGQTPGGVEIGEPANLTLIDPTEHWTVNATQFQTKSQNTPFSGWKLTGRPVATIRGRDLTRSTLKNTPYPDDKT